jgi:hypothetical protein
MADQEITVPMEEESLSSLMADEPKEVSQEQPEETAQQREDRERDEKGRFVAKAKTEEQVAPEVEAQAEVPAQTDKDEQGGNVPSWRLREVREAREAAER